MALMRAEQPLTMGWCLQCHRHPERYIRPRDKVFDMSWTPPPDQEEQGRRLLVANHVHTAQLKDCSTCHR
jgi:hypothetical protein